MKRSTAVPSPRAPDRHARCDRGRRGVERYYHTIAPFYSHEVAARGDVDFWRIIVRELAPARILELGAGAGRITEPLAASCSRLVALDLSRDMLRIARRSLAGRENIHFIVGDMRDVSFVRAFDLVVAANDPFSHLTRGHDRELALHAAARALRAGGYLILAALWFPPRIRRRMASRHGHSVARDAGPVDGRTLRITECWRSLGRPGLCEARYEYAMDTALAARATFQARAWTLAEVRSRLARNRLQLAALWGSYARTPWDAHESSQMIVAARRIH